MNPDRPFDLNHVYIKQNLLQNLTLLLNQNKLQIKIYNKIPEDRSNYSQMAASLPRLDCLTSYKDLRNSEGNVLEPFWEV